MGTCFGTYTCLSMIEHNWEKIGSAFSIHSRKFDKIRVLRIKFGRNTKKIGGVWSPGLPAFLSREIWRDICHFQDVKGRLMGFMSWSIEVTEKVYDLILKLESCWGGGRLQQQRLLPRNAQCTSHQHHSLSHCYILELAFYVFKAYLLWLISFVLLPHVSPIFDRLMVSLPWLGAGFTG